MKPQMLHTLLWCHKIVSVSQTLYKRKEIHKDQYVVEPDSLQEERHEMMGTERTHTNTNLKLSLNKIERV